MSLPDKYYWNSLLPPYSPSSDDALFYQNSLIQGTTLLLGCTHNLVPLSHRQMDVDPLHIPDTMIIADWLSNSTHYDNIIGDGVLNFTQELADGIINMSSRYCKRLIVRSFNYKLPLMRIAAYFPQTSDFNIKPQSSTILADYSFFMWDFR